MHQTVGEFLLRYNTPQMEIEFWTSYDDAYVRIAIIWLCYLMHYATCSVQVMQQMLGEFFNGRTAKSRFRISYGDSHIRISIICFRYLILCATNTSIENTFPSVDDDWKLEHFKAYADYLYKRPFISYALNHLTQHIRECKQLVNLEKIVTLLSEKLSNNPASLLLESWIESHLQVNIAASEKKSVAEDFRNNLLHAATEMKYSQVVEAVLTTGVNKEACVGGKTPLLVSAETGDIATAEVLLRKGARIDAKNDEKQTALLLAAAEGHDTMVSLLVNNGANKEEVDKYGRTALHHAAWNGHDSTVQLLVKALGADMEATDNMGSTSMHYAAGGGHDNTVKQLAGIGAKIDTEDSAKQTALHWAAIFGHDGTIQLLVKDLGANNNAEDNNGHTALHFAAFLGRKSTVRLLVGTLQMNKDAKNRKGKTALDITQQW